jgi:transposase
MNNGSPEIVSSSALHWAHPVVRQWFLNKFGAPTEPQQQGWPQILAGKTTLISAPTGSGKTLAAFLACIDQLVRKALAGDLLDETQVLYVSPLKALGNDIQKNLELPLGEILQLAGEHGLLMPPIRTGVRTGDTLIGTPTRFQRSKQIGTHVGMIPSEDSSAGKQRLGHISKQGNSLLRFLLVEAAQAAARIHPDWRRQYIHLAVRRHKSIAKVAMGRRLAIRLYWMWRNGCEYSRSLEFGSYAGPSVPTSLRPF